MVCLCTHVHGWYLSSVRLNFIIHDTTMLAIVPLSILSVVVIVLPIICWVCPLSNCFFTLSWLSLIRFNCQISHIPSKTFFLSVGGSSKTLVILNVCPNVANLSETLSALNFCSRARNATLSLGNRDTIKKWRDVVSSCFFFSVIIPYDLLLIFPVCQYVLVSSTCAPCRKASLDAKKHMGV